MAESIYSNDTSNANGLAFMSFITYYYYVEDMKEGPQSQTQGSVKQQI